MVNVDKEGIALAYGWLWHIVTEDTRVHKARNHLRGLLEPSEVQWGIEEARKAGAKVDPSPLVTKEKLNFTKGPMTITW